MKKFDKADNHGVKNKLGGKRLMIKFIIKTLQDGGTYSQNNQHRTDNS